MHLGSTALPRLLRIAACRAWEAFNTSRRRGTISNLPTLYTLCTTSLANAPYAWALPGGEDNTGITGAVLGTGTFCLFSPRLMVALQRILTPTLPSGTDGTNNSVNNLLRA